jgi:hypothetical protein
VTCLRLSSRWMAAQSGGARAVAMALRREWTDSASFIGNILPMSWMTRRTWSRRRRIVAKAEWT